MWWPSLALTTTQDNLKKSIAYTLAHAAPEVLPLFLALVLNFPLGEERSLRRGCVGCITASQPDLACCCTPAYKRVCPPPLP
jgi:hypothetical protein